MVRFKYLRRRYILGQYLKVMVAALIVMSPFIFEIVKSTERL